MTEDNPVILRDYTLIKDLGEGNFGKVKLAKLKSTKEKFAIKILDKEKLKTQTKSTLYNEIEIISCLNHKNVIHIEKILEDEKNYYIIMEYCEKGELFDYIVKKERLSSAEASLFFYQLINGVEYIHKQGFAHRDLKPENLLLTKDKILKIIDFGLCHDFDGENLLTTKCGSPSYAAPEILKGYPYDGFITDIWCCGIILYAMLCGYLPFDGDNNQEIFQSIVECNPEFPDFLEDDSVNLLSWILNSEPKDRITINEIKYHPFYLKGKNYYTIQYEESDASESDDIRNGYSSIDTRKFGFSTNRRNKGNPHVFNNSKKLKMKEGNHYKNNLYQKIFNRIINAEEDENISKIKAANAKYLLTSGNEKEKEKESKIKQKIEDNNNKLKFGNITINEKIKLNGKKLETEGNEDRKSFYMEFFRNKFMPNYLQNKSEKKKQMLLKNKEEYKLMYYGNSNNNNINTINPKLSDYNTSKTLANKYDERNLNSINVDSNKFNLYNSIKKRKNPKISFPHNNNKFLDDKNIKLFLKNKNQLKADFRPRNQGPHPPRQLDFFQKFLLNKNKAESLNKSPKKILGINCNLVLTKNKEKNNEQNQKKDSQSCDNKRTITINEHIILSQKRKNFDSIKKEPIFTKEINLLNSPAQSININKNYQSNSKPNKFFNLIYNSSNKNRRNNDADNDNSKERINIGCRSCSIKRNHPRRKNLKFDINNRLNNLRIINLNTESNTIRRENNNNRETNNIIINNNLVSINAVIKTEGKNMHFLDKVIQKLNNNKDKNSKMHIFIGPKNNEENKQVFRFLSLEKNNNEFLVNPFFVKYYKNNKNDDEKKQPILLKDENHFLDNINLKMEYNYNPGSKDKSKRFFPNLIPLNKK